MKYCPVLISGPEKLYYRDNRRYKQGEIYIINKMGKKADPSEPVSRQAGYWKDNDCEEK